MGQVVTSIKFTRTSTVPFRNLGHKQLRSFLFLLQELAQGAQKELLLLEE
ncbi:hypothetical protein HanPSC8_Chr01g0042511 [Helianthus annuus]|nr:hypothetical protein HanPSC8_Chr01g0042511 [Helianthus annuus]